MLSSSNGVHLFCKLQQGSSLRRHSAGQIKSLPSPVRLSTLLFDKTKRIEPLVIDGVGTSKQTSS